MHTNDFMQTFMQTLYKNFTWVSIIKQINVFVKDK